MKQKQIPTDTIAPGTKVVFAAGETGRVGTVQETWINVRKDGTSRELVTLTGTCGTEFAMGVDEVEVIRPFALDD
jgi:preprotein translocase subunit YajC